jgi:SAM-dependent methyltransferase
MEPTADDAEDDSLGALEECCLRNVGLSPTDHLINVACGASELPERLSAFLKHPLTQINLRVGRKPPFGGRDESADLVSFFNVFTQIHDAQMYACLQEAKRLLKPDGKIVFSFLDYEVPLHWESFAASLAEAVRDQAPLSFLNRATLEAWAMHLELSLDYLYSGEVNWMQPMLAGDEQADARSFGQSVAVLSKA